MFPLTDESNRPLTALELIEKRLAALGVQREDLRENFIQGSGKGGQKINKTSSCVQLLHPLMQIEIRCQQERSRELNRIIARRLLCEKLEKMRADRLAQKIHKREKIRRQKRGRSFGGKMEMLRAKKRRSTTKQLRSRPARDE